MEISTSTNLVHYRPNAKVNCIYDSLNIISNAGFKNIDLNFYDWSRPGMPFLYDNQWEKWTEEILKAIEDFGLNFYQSHAFVFDPPNNDINSANYQQNIKLVKRSFEIAKRLEVKVLVTHPITNVNSPYSPKKSLELNKNFYTDLIDFCEENSMNLAFENMVDSYVTGKRKYGASTYELLELVESFESPNVGICWDFEHGVKANISDQTKCIELIKDKLIATHVSDTHSRYDTSLMHILPFLGNLDWQHIIKCLKKINYNHMLSLEVHHFTHNMPDELLTHAVKFAYEVSKSLLELGNE